MARRYESESALDPALIEAALDSLNADELRGLIRETILWLDETTQARLVNVLVERAARNRSGWVPAGPSEALVADIVAFAEAAKRIGYAEPFEVDDHLQQGLNAFLSRNYGAALRIFRALLVPMCEGEFHVGQDEVVEEVLAADVRTCAAQYVVSVYMTATARHRGKAVHSAIDEMRGIGCFFEPLREMERVAVEPLPELDAFRAQWHGLLAELIARGRNRGWDCHEDRWLREVVARMEGAEGLARIARTTKRFEDLRAWCRVHAEAHDWNAALAAYDEAAELVTDSADVRGEFLDGAALSAQQLGQSDLPERLGRAWREVPNTVRLRRWLGSSKSKRKLRQRAAEALDVCPEHFYRQRALLHIVNGDFEAAAKLLASAAGLGWSGSEHPGYFLFPIFHTLLRGVEPITEVTPDLDEQDLVFNCDGPRLETPKIGALLDQAGIDPPADCKTRAAVPEAMRKAAARRIEGVTENKRRRYYAHAASLALACVRVDGSPEAVSWLAVIRNQYRRYTALQREFALRTS